MSELVGVRAHFEVDLALDDVRWRRLESSPFSNFFEFDVEQAAIEAGRENGSGRFRVRRVETVTSVVYEEAGDE